VDALDEKGLQERFSAHTSVDGVRTTLSLGGELDLATAPVLEGELDAIPWDELQELAIDLERVTFIDSTGLSILIRASQRAASAGRAFSIIRAGEQPRKLFEIAGVTESLNVTP